MPMKESMEVAKETIRGIRMKQEPIKGFIVIEADTGLDRCYFLYLLKHTLCKSPVLSRIRF
jgi:hypothetical protein